MRHTRRKGLVTLMATGGALALAAGSAQADADASGAAVDSPGVVSGNTVQLPVHVPVNACGNTVNVVGLLNPAAGNTCVNKGGQAHHGEAPGSHGSGSGHGGGAHEGGGQGGGSGHGGGAHEGGGHGGGHAPGNGAASGNGGGASADAGTHGSPGVISGNGVQLPVDLPVNVSGNQVSVVGLGNPVFGNTSVNDSGEPPATTEPPVTEEPEVPQPVDRTVVPPQRDETAPPAADAGPDRPAETGTTPALAETGAGDLAGAVLPAAAGLILAGGMLRRRLRTAADGS
ncbi:hypothetical protein BJP40_29085 [Streptomyces sp. CC53]|nr:chaplin [Streptomyces sp. CC53]OII62420.1 hypothetical protein BJP40_29085 [Streptomyces sp. CC53]